MDGFPTNRAQLHDIKESRLSIIAVQLNVSKVSCVNPVSIQVALLAVFLLSVAAANLIFLRMWRNLDSIGETPVSRFSFWATAKTLREYRRVSEHNCWPSWLPIGFWVSLLIAFGVGLILVWKAN
jgi:hypothetical protein